MHRRGVRPAAGVGPGHLRLSEVRRAGRGPL